MKTIEVEELLRTLEREGYLVGDKLKKAEEMTQDREWMFPMEDDGEARHYDRPKRRVEPEPHLDDSMPPKRLDLDPPPLRPAEPRELASHGSKLVTMGPDGIAIPAELDARIKTLEATMTDVMRRLKALEERLLDPSA